MQPLLDLIIPGYGQLPLLRRLLRSLEKHTPGDVVVNVIYSDNGTDPQDLAQLVADYPALTVIHYPGPVGFVRAVNAGLALAFMSPAPYVMLLNNDTEVHAGWLHLLDVFQEHRDAGAAGPVSDHVFGLQRREAPLPDGDWIDVPILIGFALALRKQAAQAVGFFDERFGLGNYEDWDYSLRLRTLGWKLVVDERIWVDHRLHSTFGQLGGDFNQLLETNLRKLVEKWGVGNLQLLGVQVQAQPDEPAAAPAQAESAALPPAAVRLVTHATTSWLGNIRPYVETLNANSPWDNHLLVIGRPPAGVFADYPRVRLTVDVPQTPGAPENTLSLQHGAFLDFVPGPDDDVLIYTDGDILLQRPPTAAEQALLEQLPEGAVACGWNSGPDETLALEATRLGPRVADLGMVFDGRIVATAKCYNIGVIAARRSTWRQIHAAYLELYPLAFQAFARQQRQQWLVCYVIAALGLQVQVLPYTFHMHGCYALPAGGSVNGVAKFNDELVLFRHHV